MTEINVVWVLASQLGGFRHSANAYWVLRKYKRRPGYSARYVEKHFSGYTSSSETEKFESFEELIQFLAGEHPTRKNYSFKVFPGEVLEALESTNRETQVFWQEEIEYLKKLVEPA
ncbi:hypothetical protein APY94_02905 [Thermococcus celericrescens]|uniref:Uncharacterized protein n=1 Tax=Thermococcus celericrescens TaxID=227598 RepID=A0A100XYU9_9EURY|nr:hypothetical protein [Thermococcus celericrescens]KUH34239.1 hypothetical protein APY94_02905 [Thermococcus celericrescens]